jgi:hypothetical protein
LYTLKEEAIAFILEDYYIQVCIYSLKCLYFVSKVDPLYSLPCLFDIILYKLSLLATYFKVF